MKTLKGKRRAIKVPEIDNLKTYRLLNRTTGEIRQTPDFATLIQSLATDIAYSLDYAAKRTEGSVIHYIGHIHFEVVREQ